MSDGLLAFVARAIRALGARAHSRAHVAASALLVVSLAGTTSQAAAAEAATSSAEPVRMPTSTGEVILPTPMDAQYHDEWQYAAVRRAGDLVFVSGVVAGPKPGEKPTVEAYQAGVRRAFGAIQRALRASGLDFEHVAMMNTFHVWNSPHFEGTKMQQFQAFLAVKQEFMKAPHNAWTAVGVTELLPDTGVVEIQVIAAVPRPR